MCRRVRAGVWLRKNKTIRVSDQVRIGEEVGVCRHTKKKTVDWIDEDSLSLEACREACEKEEKEEPVDWIDDAGLSLELADEQYKSVAGSTGKEQKNLSLGRQ